jgi:PTS system ascorbate-specific IIB component
MKSSINVLLVCGYGVGSSAMLETVTAKALKERSIEAKLDHTSAGELSGFVNWADIVAVNKKLMDIVDMDSLKDKHVIEIVNMMDGEGIGNKIQEIVKEHYKNAIKE